MADTKDKSGVTFSVVAVVAIVATIVAVLTHPLVGLSTLIIGVGAFVLQGLVKIPADPPHKGAETALGERTGKIIKEGWRFFPLYPYVFGFIPVDVEKKNVNLPDQLILTPDMATVKVPVHYTYTPVDLVAYLNSGGHEGVENILSDIIAQELRAWGVKKTRTRDSWEGVVKAGNSAITTLIRAVAKSGGLKPTKLQIDEAKNGTAAIPIPNLGIDLNRLNVGEIEPTGKLAKAAELMAKEKRDQKAEVVELDHIEERVAKLMDALGMTYGDAVELIQTEREKVVKTIDEKKINVSPEARAAVEGALTAGLGLLAAKLGTSTGSDKEDE